jgi:peptide/nickel transport system ATP-binding protein
VTEAPKPAGGPAPQPGSEPTAPSGSGPAPQPTGEPPQSAAEPTAQSAEPTAPSTAEPAPQSPGKPAPPGRSEPALLDVCDLRVYFPITRGTVFRRTVGHVHAVDGITLGLAAAETVGLVGESGSGKTTLGRAIVGLIPPTSGTILFRGRPLDAKDGGYRAERTQLQMVFQDPTASLDPKWRAGASIAEPLRVNHVGTRAERRQRVRELLEVVGLSPVHARRYPHELSGGQRQRVGLARALALNPAVIVADEPVSALDVSIRAQIINLLQQLQQELGLSYLFIAHDLAVVRHFSDRVAVMYLGQIVEQGGAADLYTDPRHPYTVSLLSAVPVPDPAAEARRERIILPGDPPNPAEPPPGCRFHTRCWLREQLGGPKRCAVEEPAARQISAGHTAACHFTDEVPGRAAGSAAGQTAGPVP